MQIIIYAIGPRNPLNKLWRNRIHCLPHNLFKIILLLARELIFYCFKLFSLLTSTYILDINCHLLRVVLSSFIWSILCSFLHDAKCILIVTLAFCNLNSNNIVIQLLGNHVTSQYKQIRSDSSQSTWWAVRSGRSGLKCQNVDMNETSLDPLFFSIYLFYCSFTGFVSCTIWRLRPLWAASSLKQRASMWYINQISVFFNRLSTYNKTPKADHLHVVQKTEWNFTKHAIVQVWFDCEFTSLLWLQQNENIPLNQLCS